MKRRAEELVVFLGPSLPADEARKLARCRVLPPARQGDVWRALALRPRAIALVDGVFEAQPSVWHHELLTAMEAGVAVFGGGSMGALRAAELTAHGMVGVGQIFEWYRDGVLVDDSEVALLHADAEHGYRPLTVPLVNVRHVALRARAARVLAQGQARAMVAAAANLFYQERTWRRVLEAVRPSWPATTRGTWEAWWSKGVEDLKRLDAIACIQAASEFLSSPVPPLPARSPSRSPPSSLVRRRMLVDGVSVVQGAEVSSAQVVAALQREPDSVELAEAGLRRALLAGWARTLGLVPTVEEVKAAEAEWWRQHGVRPTGREEFLLACGLDAPGLRRLCEELALERLALAHAQRLLPDGSSWEEALASEARVRGRWVQVARGLRKAKRSRAR
ncbi:TfuA-like protein [Hyalangium rubrum]|uniref:TfuA-like protein n=1 Tax=Hyalangium rubrum TaxID=3103134 RepID=A0ABU5GXM1_9BACT|nr:TfuA-like protein [Hyalangium sp. s54d21]MDY7225622.1 TfuA-like protein [Hyalangium sp. s54d21]